MDANQDRKKSQHVVPFLTGSKKYLDHFEAIPGPGSYLCADDSSNKLKHKFPSFGTRQIRGSVFSVQESPGPGSYEISVKSKKPVMSILRKKLIYNSSPSFPSKTIVYQSDIQTIKPKGTIKTKESSPIRGISFTKAPRKAVFENVLKNPEIGPGSYEIKLLEQLKGGTFNKSQKKYELGFDICKESYLQDSDLNTIQPKIVPRRLQNFGNRCERVLVEIKDTLGPGYYKVGNNFKPKHMSAPFNSSDLRFKNLFNY